MPSSGPNSASTISNDASVGTVSWTSTDADASDNVYATSDLPAVPPEDTNYLKFLNFGFSIPTDATINGIVVEFERYTDGSDVIDNIIRLVKGGSVVGDNKSAGASWTTGTDPDSYESFGGAADLWGTSWTPSDINGTTFGVVISATIQDFDSMPSHIDHGRITIHYTEATGDTYAASSNFSGVFKEHIIRGIND